MKIMKIKTAKRIIIVGIMGILIMLGYLCGFWTENKISFSNSENEISADLTEEILDDTIIMQEEIAEPSADAVCSNESKIEIENENSDENSDDNFDNDFDTEGRTHREIIEETLLQEVNMCKMIDSYEDGNWFAYYVYADGDVYVITFKCNEIDIICQLN